MPEKTRMVLGAEYAIVDPSHSLFTWTGKLIEADLIMNRCRLELEENIEAVFTFGSLRIELVAAKDPQEEGWELDYFTRNWIREEARKIGVNPGDVINRVIAAEAIRRAQARGLREKVEEE